MDRVMNSIIPLFIFFSTVSYTTNVLKKWFSSTNIRFESNSTVALSYWNSLVLYSNTNKKGNAALAEARTNASKFI